MDKLGIVGPKGEFTGNAATRAGQLLEPVIADLWSQRTGTITTPGRFTRSTVNSRFIGTPDYLTGHGNGLEIKTGVEKTWAKGCPLSYSDQARWYAMITERPVWDLYAVIVPSDKSVIPFGNGDTESHELMLEWASYRPVREYQFERDPAWEENAQEVALRFLQKVDSYSVKPEAGQRGLDLFAESFGSDLLSGLRKG